MLAHAPALLGLGAFDPSLILSGLASHAWVWTSNGLLPGQPWIDGHAGVTNQALGGLAARDWLSLQAPWWNPYSGIGMPLAAEAQNGAMFLPFVLLLALPHGLLILRIVLEMLAGAATFALLRQLRLHRAAAGLGAGLFALNGTFAWLASGPILPIAFLPVLLLGIERARARARDAPALIAAGIGFSLLAGFPEVAMIDGLLGLAWAVLRVAQQRGGRATLAGTILGGGILGLLLSAPATWPFLEALPREYLGSHAGPVGLGLRHANYAQILLPTLFGPPLASVMRLGQQSELWYRAGGFIPLSVVALLLSGGLGSGRMKARQESAFFFEKKNQKTSARLASVRRQPPYQSHKSFLLLFFKKEAFPFSSLASLLFVWLIVSLGRATDLAGPTQAFDAIPFIAQSLFHLYVLPTWSMAASVLAAIAVDRWLRGEGTLLWRPKLLLPGLAGLVCGTLFLARADLRLDWTRMPGGPAWVLGSLAGAAGMLGLLIWLGRPVPGRGRAAALLGCVLAEAVVLAALPLLSGARGRSIDEDSVAWLRAHQGLGRVLSEGPLPPNYGAWIGVAQLDANYIPTPAAWAAYLQTTLDPGSNKLLLYAPGGALIKAAEAAGVDLILTHPGTRPPPMPGSEQPVLAWQGAALDAWRLPHPMPYFRAVGAACTLAPQSRTMVITACAAPAELVRLELAWPGWRARLNGAAVPIVARDRVFQGVALPAGRAVVRFTYAPPGIAWAWGAAVLGGVLLAGWAGTRKARGLAP